MSSKRNTKRAICPECDGAGGWVDWDGKYGEACPICRGSGIVKVEHPDPFIMMVSEDMACAHGCGRTTPNGAYCDECNTDSCLVAGPDGDGICRHLVQEEDDE